MPGALAAAAQQTLPAYRPSHAALATTRPAEVSAALLSLLPHAQPRSAYYDSYHVHGDGRRARLEWLSLTGEGPESGGSGFELHAVEQFSKRQGGLAVAETKARIEAAHAATLLASPPGEHLAPPDAFALNRLTLRGAAGSVVAYEARAASLGMPSRRLGEASILVALPDGLVIEIDEPIDEPSARVSVTDVETALR